MWKNSKQINEDLSKVFEADDDPRLERFHLANVVLNGSVLTERFSADALADAITLSDYFYEAAKHAFPQIIEETEYVQKLTALKIFYFHDPLIDFERSDDVAILKEISSHIQARSAILPSRFGRETYDKFNKDFAHFARSRVSHLDHLDTLSLLRDTQQGIYQVGRFTMGPLGVIPAETRRMLPVIRSIPLWHCADTGCSARHDVELGNWQHAFLQAASQFKAALVAKCGRSSEWKSPFKFRSVSDYSVHHGTQYYDLPVALADAFAPLEVARIFERSLRSEDRKLLSARIGEARLSTNWEKASPAVIAEQCEPNAQIQLLSSLPTSRVVEIIDKAIEEGDIKVPQNEVRRSETAAPRTTTNDPRSSISSLGIRSERKRPTTFMAEVIWKSYDDEGLLADLEWRCRKAAGSASLNAPIDFIRTNDPATVIRELVLTSREVTFKVSAHIGLSIGSFDDQDLIVERILWKFGFSRARYDDRLERIQKQIVGFRSEILQANEQMIEEDREKIRSKGVNLFVNFERFLEELVSYNCWIFWSDHFLKTKFCYRKNIGTALVAEIFGKSIATKDGELRWKSEGGNTLGVLLAYASELARELNKLPLADREPLKRPAEDLPHFDDSTRFIFRHSQSWADFSEIETKRYADGFGKLIKLLSMSQIATVRNGLDHFREPDLFPKLEIMTNFATFAEQAIEIAKVNRFFPTALWLKKVVEDDTGRKSFDLEDYQGRSIIAHGPSVILGLKNIQFGKSYLAPAFNLTGYSNADLIFDVREDSAFTQLWDGYPVRQQWTVVSDSQMPESLP